MLQAGERAQIVSHSPVDMALSQEDQYADLVFLTL